jgi:hypothetical protein
MEGKVKVDLTAPIDRLIQLPSALIFHAQAMKDEGALDTDKIDRAFITMLEIGEHGHVDAVKHQLAKIANIVPGYRPPQAYRARFGSLLQQIMPKN